MRAYSACGVGLVSLLYACAPKTDVVYMNTEMNSPYTKTYAVSDTDNRIKREILETEGDAKIPKNLKERLMLEADSRGLVVETRELADGTEIIVFFPIIQGSENLSEEYSIEGYFVKKIVFYDYDRNGTVDGLNKYDRLKLRNTLEASEMVLSKRKP